jgi:hypothetical protein
MLSSQWAYIEHWFSILFPSFSTPDGASSEDILKVKTVLQLWIVQFDPHFMQSNSAWIALLNVFKNPIPWTTMLAWVSPTPGYSTDGSNEFVFPPDLSDWLAHVGADKAAFNTFSRVCDNAGCGNSHCTDAIPDSECA